MLKVNLDHFFKHLKLSNERVDNIKSKIKTNGKPFFHDLKPNFKEIISASEKYKKCENFIIIGNGGAVNSFLVLWKSLYSGDKNVTILNSMEPDLINEVKNKFPKKNTLIITSSTSGTNVGVLEIMTAFLEYEMVVITAKNSAALRTIAESLGKKIFFVPHITDRYLTSGALAYFPLAILGVDIKKIDRALHNAYEKYSLSNLENDAFKFSLACSELELNGFSEVYVPIYGSRLESFAIYITQLMHESVCKNDKGQNFLVVSAPESQHHTNQRFFGGKKNICGVFLKIENQFDRKTKIEFPKSIESDKITLRNGTVANICKVPLSNAFDFEFMGTYQDAIENEIPCAVLSLEKINEENVAELIAFFHYTAVYSSWIRDVNPFDQPQVEKSKQIAFDMRCKFERK